MPRRATFHGLFACLMLSLAACGGGGNRGSTNQVTITGNTSINVVIDNIQFAIAQNNPITEQSGSVPISITRTGSTSGSVTATVAAAGGTATSGVDFTLTGASNVTFANGEGGTKTATLTILDDAIDEPDETVQLRFTTRPGGATVDSGTTQITLVIMDDDPSMNPTSAPSAPTLPALSARTAPASVLTNRSGACVGAGCAPGTISAPYDTLVTLPLAQMSHGRSAEDTDTLIGAATAVSNANGQITAVVGAPAENGNVGSVYVYTLPAGGGTSSAAAVKIAPPIAQAMRFGFAVQLSRDGNTLVVGAPDEANNQSGIGAYPAAPNSDAPKSGAVFIYTRTAGAWSGKPVYVKAPDVDVGDGFGSSVALSADGEVLVVGAPGQDSPNGQIDVTNGAPDSGAAYVSVSRQGTWTLLNGILKATRVRSGDRFGTSVSVAPRGSTIAVGAPYEDGDAMDYKEDSGAAYLFTPADLKTGADLIVDQALRLHAANSGTGHLFGKTVALDVDGRVLAVGARLGSAVAFSVGGNVLAIGAPMEPGY